MARQKTLKYTLLFSTLLLLFTNCKENTPTENEKTTEDNLTLAKKPDSWITERVANAKEKLEKSEAGKIVWQAMEAHGGLERWFQNGLFFFDFVYIL